MKIDAFFVLSAGFGTRMGKVAEILPKPLWPIFEKTLLELQFDFYQWLEFKGKFINIHYQPSKIQNFIKQQAINIQVLYEPELLGVGGGIMNLKKNHSEIESVLISNVDQFLCMGQEKIRDAIIELPAFDAIIFGIPVDKIQGYHQLKISPEGRLQGIEISPKQDNYLTYSGVALVNGRSVLPKSERAGFFQSIAHPEEKNVKVIDAGDCIYHDFGTVELYLKEIVYLFNQFKNQKRGGLFDFLSRSNAIRPNHFDRAKGSYNSRLANEYEFKDLKISFGEQIRVESEGVVDFIKISMMPY